MMKIFNINILSIVLYIIQYTYIFYLLFDFLFLHAFKTTNNGYNCNRRDICSIIYTILVF